MNQLHFKPLTRLWDNASFPQEKPSKHHHIDGVFTAKTLFSIEAFATNPKVVNASFNKQAFTLFLEQLRTQRDKLHQQHDRLLKETGDIHFVPFYTNKNVIEIKLDPKYLCRSSGLLIKLFMTADAYLFDLYRARHNEEIQESYFHDCYRALINQLRSFLNDLCQNAQRFHIERKKHLID